MIKFPKFKNLEDLWNLEKLSNTLSVEVIKKRKKKKKKKKKKIISEIIE